MNAARAAQDAAMPPRSTKKASALELEKERLERELQWRVEELERERTFLRTVVDSSQALFCVLDHDGCIVRFNDALAQPQWPRR